MYGYSESLAMGHGYWFSWIIGLIIFIIIIGLVVMVVNQNNKLKKAGSMSHLDILKNRYAKGEISKTEFDEKKRDIL